MSRLMPVTRVPPKVQPTGSVQSWPGSGSRPSEEIDDYGAIRPILGIWSRHAAAARHPLHDRELSQQTGTT
jgi:hypothetical protein